MCALEDAARSANQRVQFGEAIGRFQLIQEKFAHWGSSSIQCATCYMKLHGRVDNGLITSGDAAMCKYLCANAAFEVVNSRCKYWVVSGLQVTTG
ncbi:acyl-CoA dehydrogenase family protein [Shigella flexneri]